MGTRRVTLGVSISSAGRIFNGNVGIIVNFVLIMNISAMSNELEIDT